MSVPGFRAAGLNVKVLPAVLSACVRVLIVLLPCLSFCHACLSFRHACFFATFVLPLRLSFRHACPSDTLVLPPRKDCIVLSVSPPEGYKSPLSELRETIPVRLTTDAWAEEMPQQQPPAYIPHFSPPPGLVAD